MQLIRPTAVCSGRSLNLTGNARLARREPGRSVSSATTAGPARDSRPPQLSATVATEDTLVTRRSPPEEGVAVAEGGAANGADAAPPP